MWNLNWKVCIVPVWSHNVEDERWSPGCWWELRWWWCWWGRTWELWTWRWSWWWPGARRWWADTGHRTRECDTDQGERGAEHHPHTPGTWDCWGEIPALWGHNNDDIHSQNTRFSGSDTSWTLIPGEDSCKRWVSGLQWKYELWRSAWSCLHQPLF